MSCLKGGSIAHWVFGLIRTYIRKKLGLINYDFQH